VAAYIVYPKVSLYIKTRRIDSILARKVSSVAGKFSGSYYLLVKSLSHTRFLLSHRFDSNFPPASLIKFPIMAAAFSAISEGWLSLNDKFKLTRGDIIAGSGVLRYSRIPRKISLRKLIKLMIILSDNTAANKIIGILGFNYINSFFRRNNLNDTVLARKIMDLSARKRGIENWTSCRDMAYLYERLYKRKLINAADSVRMLSLLKQQRINDRIPKYLPRTVIVAHKTGLDKDVVGDCGIVFSRRGDYILCVAVSHFSTYRQAKEFIAKISLVVYNTVILDKWER